MFQITIPAFFVLTSVRLLLTRGFVRMEYALPGFPADPYGFSKADRLHYADLSLEYLLNDQEVDFLGKAKLDNGSALYNDRELRHMEDVKRVTQSALRIWVGSAVASVLLGVVIQRVAGTSELARAMRGGAVLAASIMLLLVVGLAIGFSVLFVGFHRVFFEGDTWLFRYSDSLIRLFPELFWQAAFATIGLVTMAQSGLLYLISRWVGGRGA